jgi:SAM-dependent methyltransferase
MVIFRYTMVTVMDDPKQTNLKHWNALVPIHANSAFYNTEGFKAGKLSLLPIELEEVDDVRGKSLLHLQCHFGLDSLSWARLGADVTGVDFAERGIELATRLSDETNVPARFICSDLYELRDVLDEHFDIVYTSYGVLAWLPDLTRWAEIIEHYLKPGGTFFIVEEHPFLRIYNNDGRANEMTPNYPYIHGTQPHIFDWVGTYANYDADIQSQSVEWDHSLGEIMNSLIDAGLSIEYLHEFPYCAWPMFSFMERREDGYFHMTKYQDMLPMMFSLKATKPG